MGIHGGIFKVSNTSAVRLDLGDFDKRVAEYGKGRVPKIVKVAMWEAAAALKKDADEIAPKTPHLYGNLRGDAVRGVKAKGSGKTNRDCFPKIANEDLGGNIVAVLVTYCAPYAARWHEAVGENINWSEDGVGPKFLEAKMAREDLRNKYYGLIALRIREGSGK